MGHKQGETVRVPVPLFEQYKHPVHLLRLPPLSLSLSPSLQAGFNIFSILKVNDDVIDV